MNTRQSLDQFREEIKAEVKAKTIELTTKGFKRLVHLSPYKYGSYILSHRIGINSADNSFTIMPNLAELSKEKQEGAPKIGRAAAKAKAKTEQLKKIPTIKAFDSIYLTNNVPHGLLIETGSWSSQAPLGVYSLVKIELAGIK